jgi:phosphoribosylformylglycinamidine synthase subunit PurS
MKVKIVIGLKKKILDPQGRAIQHALETMGYKNVTDVRMGKYIELEVPPQGVESLRQQVHEICEKLLTNPVTEDFRFEVDESSNE